MKTFLPQREQRGRPLSRHPGDRRRAHDLSTRIGRARLVYLLGRSGSPLTDWLPLALAAVTIGLMMLGAPGSGDQAPPLGESQRVALAVAEEGQPELVVVFAVSDKGLPHDFDAQRP